VCIQRNPSIKLYGLPWTFPGWVAMGTQNPFTNATVTAHYLLKWIQGAKKYYNLDIDFLGVSTDVEFLLMLGAVSILFLRCSVGFGKERTIF